MPLYRSLTRNTRERPSTANILWHMNMAAHVLLLAGGHVADVCDPTRVWRDWRSWGGGMDHVSRISVCVPSQKMAQKQFSILQNIQIRLSDKCLKVSHSSRLHTGIIRGNEIDIWERIHEHEENLICFMFNLVHSLAVLKWCRSIALSLSHPFKISSGGWGIRQHQPSLHDTTLVMKTSLLQNVSFLWQFVQLIK